MDEQEALHAASSWLSRLDERLGHDRLARAHAEWCLTQEAIGIAACEGMAVREEDLSALLTGGDRVYDKSTRTAEDLRAALARAVSARTGPLGAEAIVDLFEKSEHMNVARTDGSVGYVDNDAVDAAREIAAFTSPNPWTAAEAVRSIVAGPRFRGRGVRMGLLLSPCLASAGFGLTRAVPMAAASLSKVAGGPRRAAEDRAAWTAAYFAALAAGARRAYEAATSFARVAAEVDAAAGKRRVSSKLQDATEAFLARPVRCVQDLATDLDLTHGGTTFVLRQMTEAGVVSQYRGGGGKGRLFVMTKALNLR